MPRRLYGLIIDNPICTIVKIGDKTDVALTCQFFKDTAPSPPTRDNYHN